MNTDLPTEKQSLLKGIKEHIDAALGAKPGTSPYCSKTTSLAVCGQKSKVYDLEKLVHNMWGAIAKLGRNGRKLERRRIMPLGVNPQNGCSLEIQEIKWQRGMIDSIREGLNKKKWGMRFLPLPALASGELRRPGPDLAHHKPEDRCMQMIELKVTPKSQNPVSAALQISVYAMMLSRWQDQQKRREGNRRSVERRGDESAELYVLAPAVSTLSTPDSMIFSRSSAPHWKSSEKGLPMSFGFRVCDWYNDDLKYPEEALLEALSTPMPSVIN